MSRLALSSMRRKPVPAAILRILIVIAAFGLRSMAPCPAGALPPEFPDLEGADAHWELGYLPMDDGVRLAYIVWRPRPEGRFPVLLIFSPYPGGGANLGITKGHYGHTLDYMRHGYAVVYVSIRGSGCSEGVFDILSERNARDGAAAVEWAGSQPWSTGAVGLFGNSYDGMTQYLIAARRPRHLKALAAGAAPGDLYSGMTYPGGIFNASFFSLWSYESQPMGSGWGVDFRLANGDGECAQIRRRQRPNPVFDAVRSHPHRDAWWQARHVAAMAARIEVPVLITQAWQDQEVAVSGAVHLYERITAPKKMMLANGDHGFYNLDAVLRERIRWYDRWLKGEANGIDREPPVTVWFEQREEHGQWKKGWTEDFADWPAPGLEWKTLQLTADGRLLGEPPGTEASVGERHYIYPTATELIGSSDAFRLPQAPFGSLVYRSAPVEGDLTILGAPALVLYLASEREDTDLMVVLHDVDPQGRVQFLQRGFLRASHNARTVDTEFEPDLSRSHEAPAPLRPGTIYELRLELYPLGHVLRRGHALELAILAPNPLPQPAWGLANVMLPGRNTIHHSQQQPSRLLLPVVPGLSAKAPPPECGSLPMQPCRPSTAP